MQVTSGDPEQIEITTEDTLLSMVSDGRPCVQKSAADLVFIVTASVRHFGLEQPGVAVATPLRQHVEGTTARFDAFLAADN